jgi:hypothetical protein
LHTLFLLNGGSSIPIFRVVIASRSAADERADGRRDDHHEVRSDGSPTPDVVVKGKDLTAAHGHHPARRAALSAMRPALAACSPRWRSTRRFGSIPLVIPSILEDMPIPIERIPRHQGTDYATSRRSRTRRATSSTSTRGRRR